MCFKRPSHRVPTIVCLVKRGAMNADDEEEPGPGNLVAGRYRIDELIGRGGMGTIWHAVDELLDREVAIKRIRLDTEPGADDALARERMLREARIAAKLHHPHIVSIFDVIERDDPWLILEYVPSRSLASILTERGRLPPGEVAAIGAQIADALATAHRAGVVHRDVKPDNILITHPVEDVNSPGQNHPTAKLADFGISHATNTPTLTATGILAGTPAYFAPETARGEGNDPRTDVYSLGATLYAATEGNPPFGRDTENILALLTRIARGGAPPPQHAGPLIDLLQQLLHDDPGTRPTAVQAHHGLQHGVADGGIAETPEWNWISTLAAGCPTQNRRPPPSWIGREPFSPNLARTAPPRSFMTRLRAADRSVSRTPSASPCTAPNRRLSCAGTPGHSRPPLRGGSRRHDQLRRGLSRRRGRPARARRSRPSSP
jgi:serine/threonine protein kinase